MSFRTLDKSRAIRKIKLRLGHPKQCVELTDEHFEEGLDDTDRWWVTWRGNTKEKQVTISGSQQEIEVEPDVCEVLEVILPSQSTDYVAALQPGLLGTNAYPTNMFSYTADGASSGLHLVLADREIASRVLGAERAWEWDQHVRKIRLYPRGTSTSEGGTLVYTYTTSDVDLGTMSPYEQKLYLDWYETEMKMMLGRIRSKYSEYPGAGGAVSLDGETLISEAREDREKLMEEVRSLPLGFLAG